MTRRHRSERCTRCIVQLGNARKLATTTWAPGDPGSVQVALISRRWRARPEDLDRWADDRPDPAPLTTPSTYTDRKGDTRWARVGDTTSTTAVLTPGDEPVDVACGRRHGGQRGVVRLDPEAIAGDLRARGQL